MLQDAGESKALCLCDREVAFLESLPLSEQVQLADLLAEMSCTSRGRSTR